jgi:hypothetical protein
LGRPDGEPAQTVDGDVVTDRTTPR